MPRLGQIVAGLKPGRESDDETILFWHRGLSLSDIALGHAMLEKAKRLGIGQRLRFSPELTAMAYVANARMYSVNPGRRGGVEGTVRVAGARKRRRSARDRSRLSAAAGRVVVARRSRPAPSCADFPIAAGDHPPKPVLPPFPMAAPMPGQPVYATRLVVRRTSDFNSLEDTFGGRLGYTVDDSHSGYNALRHHLLPYQPAAWRQALSRKRRPAVHAAAVIEALLAGRYRCRSARFLCVRPDAAPSSPIWRRQIRIVATTDAAPIPFLVASLQCPDDVVAELRTALIKFGDVAACADLEGPPLPGRFCAGHDRRLRSGAALGRRSARRGISTARLRASKTRAVHSARLSSICRLSAISGTRSLFG